VVSSRNSARLMICMSEKLLLRLSREGSLIH
jgi:hypothetical protein